MKYGYLVLASSRRVLNVVLGDDTDAIRHTIGCRSIEHGTTLASEDQLIIDGGDLDGVPNDRFWVAGVPFPFSGNAILIGIDLTTGDTADRPTMELAEFRRLVSFTRCPKHGWSQQFRTMSERFVRALKRLAKPVQHRRMTRDQGIGKNHAVHQTASVGQMSSQEYCKR